MCWRLSAPGLCNALFPAAQDISQCSQAEVAQRVPERKPKIGPAHLSVCGHRSFHGSAWTSESARIHPQNQISSLSFSVMRSLFWWSNLTTADHMVCEDRTVVSEPVVILFLSDAVRGLRFFREKMAKTKSSYALICFFTSKFRFIQPSCMFPQWRRTWLDTMFSTRRQTFLTLGIFCVG